MTMTKKYAICNVHAVTGNYITILNMEEYCLAMCDIDIIEESDNYNDIQQIYKENYNNVYVTDKWLKENGYTHSIKNAFVGKVNNYLKHYNGGRIEITLSDVKPGYEVEITDRNLGFMHFYNCKNNLTIDKFNALINLFS